MTAAEVAIGAIIPTEKWGGRKEAMKVLDDLQLPPRLLAALQAARDRIVAEFDVDRMVLFGSIVEGTSDEESDVDLLVVLRQCPSLQRRDRLTGVILDINLEYDVNLSELIVDRHTWDKGLPSILPIHEKIEEEGIPL
jgi:predicted nucleotidyltransferase